MENTKKNCLLTKNSFSFYKCMYFCHVTLFQHLIKQMFVVLDSVAKSLIANWFLWLFIDQVASCMRLYRRTDVVTRVCVPLARDSSDAELGLKLTDVSDVEPAHCYALLSRTDALCRLLGRLLRYITPR